MQCRRLKKKEPALQAKFRSMDLDRDEFILMAGILHNVNNYLQTIIGSATLGMYPSLGGDMKEHYKLILTTADRCSKTIRQMMTMVTSAKRESHEVDIRSVVSEVIDMFKPVAGNVVHISCSCEDVPSVYGDESDISQIILNLLINARDAIHENGEISISIYRAVGSAWMRNNIDEPGDYVGISVRDNGPGIPESIQKKLFTEVGTTKTETSHCGIGLVVSRFFAERHGGRIECAHTDNRGTEFVIYFQACSDAVEQQRT